MLLFGMGGVVPVRIEQTRPIDQRCVLGGGRLPVEAAAVVVVAVVLVLAAVAAVTLVVVMVSFRWGT